MQGKKYPIFAAAVIFLSFVPVLLQAETNWLEKGTHVLNSLSAPQSKQQGLSNQEIGSGLKEALKVGTENVVRQLGAVDGFNNDAQIHIPLPQEFATVKSVLGKVGMAGMLDDLELKLNRAAEAATPKAKELFWKAITEMTISDVQGIYSGPSDAATKYFQGKMTPELAKAMKPIVDKSLAEVGAVQLYDQVMAQYKAMPFVPDVKADLTRHVLDKGMDGIFYYMAKEEAAIRSDPAKRTSQILQKVFGATR